jgi:glycine cleavage system transcriptional repressor
VPEFAVTAIGQDRPGIVAGVSGALLELGGNIEDSQMAILGGHFSVMLLVSVPDDVDRDRLAARLGRVRDELRLEAITIADVARPARAMASPTHVLSVYGADHPGIVHSVTAALAGLGVNITDLETRITAGEDPLYAMLVEVVIPAAEVEEVEASLRRVGESEGVEVSLRPIEAEAL